MKEFRQCVQIFFNLNVAGQNNQNVPPFNLNFQPDEVIVKQVTYTVVTPEPFTYVIETNLTEQPILCSFQGSVSNSVPIDCHFSLRSYSNRAYKFQILENSGAGFILSAGIGELSLMLEFVKHSD
jgi:hypothetical protein